MVDVSHQVLRYMHEKYGPDKPLSVALTHEGRGIPRHVRQELTSQYGRHASLGAVLEQYQPQLVQKNFP